jgi:hypothetical protein
MKVKDSLERVALAILKKKKIKSRVTPSKIKEAFNNKGMALEHVSQ